jgi:hypothetical protein
MKKRKGNKDSPRKEERLKGQIMKRGKATRTALGKKKGYRGRLMKREQATRTATRTAHEKRKGLKDNP